MQGWISLHRQFQEHALWQEPRVFSKAEAWIDILMEVQHDTKQTETMIKNTIITCDRGQSIKSIQTWAERWTWSRSAIQRFLTLLKRQGMITTENLTKTIRLSVCNYNTYQNPRSEGELKVIRRRSEGDLFPDTDNNDNNDNNGNNEINKQLFDESRKLFKGTKRGLDPEFKNFKKKHKTWKEIIPLLKPSIENQIIWRNEDNRYWKNFQTWINNSCWTEEKETYERNNNSSLLSFAEKEEAAKQKIAAERHERIMKNVTNRNDIG